ncbi:DDE superfamily endonuclease [Nitrospirillum amazonense]|uniref:DDE superfamily endonuclease n=1 Tax=Nitrospirillum amazonense TaxID=28077 RepID=A0A560EK92_9PROT|nr:IS701 family transposase [Nitrospirillum amazonense]TWB09675.1 DDE superfamily endonuclease [Nitrospirillum amazonense]
MENKADFERFERYLCKLQEHIGHVDRHKPLKDYCIGLLAAGGRKTAGPLAAFTAPNRSPAQHQALLHFIGKAPWPDALLLREAGRHVWPSLGGPSVWAVDEYSFRKQGKHSVGVLRQSCPELGKVENCQIAVTLTGASATASLPMDYRLYLPREWADDDTRREKAAIPATIHYRSKKEIAIDLIMDAMAAGADARPVLAGCDYGADPNFRKIVGDQGLDYVMDVPGSTLFLVEPVVDCLISEPSGQYTSVRLRTGLPERGAMSAEHLAAVVRDQMRPMTEQILDALTVLKVSPVDDAPMDGGGAAWLVIRGGSPVRHRMGYSVTNMAIPARMPEIRKVPAWRDTIRKGKLQLKQELGLGHYEGRSWRGFHHHATLCVAVQAFLSGERYRPGPAAVADLMPPAVTPQPIPSASAAACG